jgi:DNA-binding transcriptional ArsR family regulator
VTNNALFAEVASLAGDPARAGMLHALMDGRALTASELAVVAGVTPQTASSHLARMTTAGLLAVQKQGRHRYHRLASPAVARMMESIMQVAADLKPARPRLVVGPRDAALRAARTCYDHLAGHLGVALADAMVRRGQVELTADAGLLTEEGARLLARVGIDVESLAARTGRSSRRILCRPCLDWSERRPHLAGALGAALCSHSLASGWIRRVKSTRAVAVTPKGQRAFRDHFGFSAPAPVIA